MTNADVVKAFYQGKQASTKSEYLWTNANGSKLFSYLTCIAQKIDGKVIKNITRYSNTTSKHQSLVINYDGVVINVPKNTTNLTKYIYEG